MAVAKKVQERRDMATSKVKVVPAKEETPDKDTEGAPESPLPLLNLHKNSQPAPQAQ